MESFYKEDLDQLQNVNPPNSLAHIHLAALLKHRFNMTSFSLKEQRSSPSGRSLPATGTACVLSHSVVTDSLWPHAHQAPLSMGFPRQEYCSGLPCPPPGNLPKPGTESTSPVSPVLAGNPLPPSHLKPLGTPYLYPEYPTWWLLKVHLFPALRACFQLA